MLETININWCERFLIVFATSLSSLLLINLSFAVFPVSGIWLFLFALLIVIGTIWSTCLVIQQMLLLPLPISYEFKTLFIKFENTRLFKNIQHYRTEFQYKEPIESKNKNSNKKYDPNSSLEQRIELLAKDICNYFLETWYLSGVSNEQTFPIESQEILLDGIRRFLQVSRAVDSTKVAKQVLALCLRHCKEFRRAQKRMRRGSLEQNINTLYRYNHSASKSSESLENYAHNVTLNVLQEFISWELWNSVPCKILVSIISRRAVLSSIEMFSNPEWINDTIRSYIDTNFQPHTKKSENSVQVATNIIEEIKQEKMVTPQVNTKIESEELTEINTKRNIESALTTILSQTTAPVLNLEHTFLKDNSQNNKLSEDEIHISSPIIRDTEITSRSVLQDDNQATRSVSIPEPNVKVYNQLRAGSIRTWDAGDLQCISLGQDLLAMDSVLQEVEMPKIRRRLWENDPLDNTDAIPWSDEPINQNEMWFGEEDNINQDDDIVLPSHSTCHSKAASQPIPTSLQSMLKPVTTSTGTIISNTIRPIGNATVTTLNNMKELQHKSAATVNNAVHKIGDLQDEAAGVMEGIFDFGMAGLRKGLRLTGLQEHSDTLKSKDATATTSSNDVHDHQESSHDKEITKSKNIDYRIPSNIPHIHKEPAREESVWINPLMKDSSDSLKDICKPQIIPTSYSSELNLLRENLDDMNKYLMDTTKNSTPAESVLTFVLDDDSPEYEYEDTGDLATTIAKLRSLLQQRSSESSLNTPAVSPLPDEKVLSKSMTETPRHNLNLPIPATDSTTQSVSNYLSSPYFPTNPMNFNSAQIKNNQSNMPRLDKLLARTVTEVFNSIKTALPGTTIDQEGLPLQNYDHWNFIETDASDTDLNTLVERLLVERRDYCTIDRAHEAMDSLELLSDPQTPIQAWETTMDDDDCDDMELAIPLTKLILDILCESLQDTNNCVLQEPVFRSILVLFGTSMEQRLRNIVTVIAQKFYSLIGPFQSPTEHFKETKNEQTPTSVSILIDLIKILIPGYMQEVIGQEDLDKCLNFLLESLQHIKINREIICQFIDIYAAALMHTRGQITPNSSS